MKFKGDILIIFVTIILVAVEGLPLEHYLPFFRHIRNDRNSVITDYFNLGLSYIEIHCTANILLRYNFIYCAIISLLRHNLLRDQVLLRDKSIIAR